MDTNIDNNVAIHDVKRRKCKKGLILGILLVLIALVGSLLTIIYLKKQDSNPGKYFKKTTYFYGKSTTDLDGPMPLIIRFDKDGKYMTVSVDPKQYGTIGTYEIDGEKITLNSSYAYTSRDNLSASISTYKETGTYKDDKIEMSSYEYTLTNKNEFDKYNKGGHTYSDIEKAYKNGGKIDKPVEDDLDTYCDTEKSGTITSKDHTFTVSYEASSYDYDDGNKVANQVFVTVTNDEGTNLLNGVCFIRGTGHMFEFAINSDDTITVVSPVDAAGNSIAREENQNDFIVDILDYDGNNISTKKLNCKDLSYGTPQAISDQETICPEEY